MKHRIQSNPVNTDTEGALESVRIKGIKRVEFGESARTFFPGDKANCA